MRHKAINAEINGAADLYASAVLKRDAGGRRFFEKDKDSSGEFLDYFSTRPSHRNRIPPLEKDDAVLP